jgi:hypothetical protein
MSYRDLEDHEKDIALSYKKRTSLERALIFSNFDIPEIIERVRDCFYGGIMIRLSELADYFRVLHGFALNIVTTQIRFEKVPKADKLAGWLECLDYKLFVLRSLPSDSSCAWIQRFDNETKLIIEDLLAEEADLIRKEERSLLLGECLVDQLASLFGTELPFLQLPWNHILDLYSFAYKRKFPLDLLLANFYSGKRNDYDRSFIVITEALAGIQNRRLAPSLRKNQTELWILINSQGKVHQHAGALQAACSKRGADNVPVLKAPTETLTPDAATVLSSEHDEEAVTSFAAESHFHSAQGISYYEPLPAEQFIACRLFQCFQGGLLMRFSELPTIYTKLFQTVLDFKSYVKDGYAYKKFMDWIKSLPYFQMPDYAPELRVYWIRRRDLGVARYISDFQSLRQDTLSFCLRPQTSAEDKKLYLTALFKRQLRSLFGTVTRVRIASLQLMLLDTYGPQRQIPIYWLLSSEPRDMASIRPPTLLEMIRLMKNWRDDPIRYLSMGSEDFTQIMPLPTSERLQCVCKECTINNPFRSSSHRSLLERLGLNIVEEVPSSLREDSKKPFTTASIIKDSRAFLNLPPSFLSPSIPTFLGLHEPPPSNLLDQSDGSLLFGLDVSFYRPLKKQKNLSTDFITDDDALTVCPPLFTNLLTAATLPYYLVTQQLFDDHFGDFKAYL